MSEHFVHPRITIGMPVRNGEKYLEETLLSLVSQDYPNLEIVVSDNASNEETKAILSRFEAGYPQIKVFAQAETLSIIDNFAYVLIKATGEYFCWAAHDDIRSPGSIKAQAEVLDKHPEINGVMTDVVNFYDDSDETWPDRLEGIRLEKVIASWKEVRKAFFSVPISNAYFCIYGLFRTEVIRRVNLHVGIDFITNVEIPILAQAALLGPLASIEVDGFRYRRHSQSYYHQEMAKESREAADRRRTIIRKLVSKIILGSSLPLSEKLGLFLPLVSGDVKERTARVGNAAGKTFKKRKSAMKKFSLRRSLRRLKNRVLGVEEKQSTAGERRQKRVGENWKGREGRAGGKRGGKNRKPRSILEAEVNLDAPDVALLVERERERARLEAAGWTFVQPKRLKLISDRRITTLIDCGSNAGQYVEELKKTGWTGKVFSFEPLSDAYSKLRAKAEASEGWKTYQCALGEENGESTIQIAGNSYSSSLLQFSDDFKELRPDASPVGSETVTVRRLDDVVKEEGLTFEGPMMLKIDVQGFEMSVLRGALKTLPRVSILQCELALVPSYEGGATFVEVRDFLRERGFVLAHLIDGHANHETGELREVDGVFLNTRVVSPDA
ncbi:MAG: FkbM family methyltransferase [Verrucomicrobiales bacterium]|nr:FkbM family methyltransferase [Verrucomicrobiales bacterium]